MARRGAGRARPERTPVAAWAAALSVAALIARVAYVVHLRGSPLADFPVLDELYHVEWARALAAGDWLGSAVYFRAPLYPYTLAALFALFGESLFAARLVQAAVSALACPVVYLLGRRVFDERVGRAAGIVAVLYPFFIYFSNELLIVTLIVLLDLMLLLAVLRADEAPSAGRWVGAGALIGVSAIARPSVLAFLPALFLWMWGRARSGASWTAGGRGATGGRAAARFALVVAGAAVVILPVTLRNYAVGRDFVPIASQGGINFFIGNNPSADGASAVLPVLGEAWENEDAERIAESHAGRDLRPSEVSAFWYAEGREFLFGSPGAAARLYLKKLVLFWDRYELANNKDIYFFGNISPVFRWLSWLNFGLVAPLALLGIIVTVRRNSGALLLAAFVVSYMAGVLLFFVNSRFRLPLVPVLILFAAAAVFWLVERVLAGDVRRLAASLAFLAAAAFFVNYDFYDTHVGDRAQTHMTLGRVLAARGMHAEAVAEYERALELSPGYAKAMNSKGLALEELGRDEEALESYLSAASTDSTLASARNNIGSFYLKKGDKSAARHWFEEAVRLDEYLEQAHMNLAVVLAEEGDLSGAEYHLKAAVTAEPGFKEAWDALGRVFEQTGRVREAVGAYGRAVTIDPAYVQARHDLGVALAMTGRYEAAARELERALSLAPDDPAISANLARVRELMATRRPAR